MKCEISYDNSLLNDGELMRFVGELGAHAMNRIINTNDRHWRQ